MGNDTIFQFAPLEDQADWKDWQLENVVAIAAYTPVVPQIRPIPKEKRSHKEKPVN